MSADFEVVACHCDHAGKAHLSVRRLDGGAEIAIQNIPFDAVQDESLVEEQARILADAARLAGQAAAFLQAEAKLERGWPTRSAKLSDAPGDGGQPNAFGQPTPRA
jgi:hypothetical protein